MDESKELYSEALEKYKNAEFAQVFTEYCTNNFDVKYDCDSCNDSYVKQIAERYVEYYAWAKNVKEFQNEKEFNFFLEIIEDDFGGSVTWEPEGFLFTYLYDPFDCKEIQKWLRYCIGFIIAWRNKGYPEKWKEYLLMSELDCEAWKYMNNV